jgi:hypothetical protein
MPRATAVLREKVIDENGNILELVIWRVPRTSRSPSGVRYRLAFIQRGKADVGRITGDDRWPRR